MTREAPPSLAMAAPGCSVAFFCIHPAQLIVVATQKRLGSVKRAAPASAPARQGECPGWSRSAMRRGPWWLERRAVDVWRSAARARARYPRVEVLCDALRD